MCLRSTGINLRLQRRNLLMINGSGQVSVVGILSGTYFIKRKELQVQRFVNCIQLPKNIFNL